MYSRVDAVMHYAVSGRIRSPRFPTAYDNQMERRDVIHTPRGSTTELHLEHLDIELAHHCAYDSLTVRKDRAD